MKPEYETELKEVEMELRDAIIEGESKQLISLLIKRLMLASERVGYAKAMDEAWKIMGEK